MYYMQIHLKFSECVYYVAPNITLIITMPPPPAVSPSMPSGQRRFANPHTHTHTHAHTCVHTDMKAQSDHVPLHLTSPLLESAQGSHGGSVVLFGLQTFFAVFPRMYFHDCKMYNRQPTLFVSMVTVSIVTPVLFNYSLTEFSVLIFVI